MPNHVATRLTFRGQKEEVEQLVNEVKTKALKPNQKGRAFDFNQIIPMPKSLDIISGTVTDNGMQYLLLKAKNTTIGWTDSDHKLVERMEKNRDSENKEERERFAESIKLGRKALSNIVKYGYPTWYEWCSKNWGTKWNAYDIEDSDLPNSITFNTAWRFPYPVIQKLSEIFPDVTIEFVYADEDCGSNTGCGEFKAGELVNSEFPDTDSKRAYELYIASWGEQN